MYVVLRFASHDEVSQIVASAALSALRVTSTRVVVCAVREEVTNKVNIFRVFFSTLLAGMAARCKTALPVQI